MHAKQLVIGTLVGAVTVLAIGYLLFTAALGYFYAYAMSAGSATGVSTRAAVVLGRGPWGAFIQRAPYARDRDSGQPPVHGRRRNQDWSGS